MSARAWWKHCQSGPKHNVASSDWNFVRPELRVSGAAQSRSQKLRHRQSWCEQDFFSQTSCEQNSVRQGHSVRAGLGRAGSSEPKHLQNRAWSASRTSSEPDFVRKSLRHRQTSSRPQTETGELLQPRREKVVRTQLCSDSLSSETKLVRAELCQNRNSSEQSFVRTETGSQKKRFDYRAGSIRRPHRCQ